MYKTKESNLSRALLQLHLTIESLNNLNLFGQRWIQNITW